MEKSLQPNYTVTYRLIINLRKQTTPYSASKNKASGNKKNHPFSTGCQISLLNGMEDTV